MTNQEAFDLLSIVRWKTGVCNSGEKCWCRTIVPETPIQDEYGVNMFVIPDGAVDEYTAMHIVELHNKWVDL